MRSDLCPDKPPHLFIQVNEPEQKWAEPARAPSAGRAPKVSQLFSGSEPRPACLQVMTTGRSRTQRWQPRLQEGLQGRL